MGTTTLWSRCLSAPSTESWSEESDLGRHGIGAWGVMANSARDYWLLEPGAGPTSHAPEGAGLLRPHRTSRCLTCRACLTMLSATTCREMPAGLKVINAAAPPRPALRGSAGVLPHPRHPAHVTRRACLQLRSIRARRPSARILGCRLSRGGPASASARPRRSELRTRRGQPEWACPWASGWTPAASHETTRSQALRGCVSHDAILLSDASVLHRQERLSRRRGGGRPTC